MIPSRLSRLFELQHELDEIRRELGINSPGAILHMSGVGYTDRAKVIEADGFGGAMVLIVEGNYPLDYLAISEQYFSSEAEALLAAEG